MRMLKVYVPDKLTFGLQLSQESKHADPDKQPAMTPNDEVSQGY
jgi:hypothetical protein